MNISRKIKGSGILVVILSAVVFSIYVTSNFADSQHYGILQEKYEKNIKEKYEKNIDNVDEFYDYILDKNNM